MVVVLLAPEQQESNFTKPSTCSSLGLELGEGDRESKVVLLLSKIIC
jgi:hypothetical protein